MVIYDILVSPSRLYSPYTGIKVPYSLVQVIICLIGKKYIEMSNKHQNFRIQ